MFRFKICNDFVSNNIELPCFLFLSIGQPIRCFFLSSVTRFVNISPLWQDFKNIWPFLKVYLVSGRISNMLRQFFMLWTSFVCLHARALAYMRLRDDCMVARAR